MRAEVSKNEADVEEKSVLRESRSKIAFIKIGAQHGEVGLIRALC